MSENQINDADLSLLLQSCSVQDSITKLCLNKLNTHKISSQVWVTFHKYLSCSTNLTHLELKYLNVSNEASKSILNAVHNNKSIKVLKILGSLIQDGYTDVKKP